MTKTLGMAVRFGAGVSLLAVAPALAAQDQDSESFGFEEIVVTANKREQSFDEVAISISAIAGESLQNFAAGGEDIRLLSSRVPGLNAESSNGRVGPRFYIRGLGNTDFDLAASQPVSIIFDEIVQENVILKSFPVFDVERVEVLRGPQGTLFGRNTPAGIVKFETRKPTEELEGYFRINAGERETFGAEGAVGGALADGIQARFSAIFQHRGDFVDNDFLGENSFTGGFDELAARLQVNFDLTEDFSALLNIHGRTLTGTSALFRANVLDTGSNELNDNFDRDTVFFGDTDGNPQEYDTYGGSIRLEWDVTDTVSLTSISAYEGAEGFSLGDIDGGNPTGPGFIPFQSTTQDGLDNLDQFTQEVRLAHEAADNFFYQVGFFYFDSDFTIRTSPFFVPDSTVRHENQTWAVFGQFTYDINDSTALTGGIRYTDDERSADAFSGAFGAQLPTIELEGDRVSWDVSINHILDDSLSIYARVAEGFRAPSIQSRDVAFFGVPTTAPEEVITSYEAGFKANLGNRIRWNGAVYYYDVSDQQVTAVGGIDNSVQLVSIEEVVGIGFETDVEWLVNENLTFTAGLAWNNTQINDPDLLVPVCGSGQCTPLDELTADGFAIVDGNPLPQAPEWTANATIDYHYPVGDSEEIFLLADWALQGRTNFFLYEAEEFFTNGTFELGLRIGYRWNDGQYEVAAFARNLTGEDNIKGIIDFNNNTAFVNEPRIIGVSLGANF